MVCLSETTVSQARREDWPKLLRLFPHATVFHSLPWLEAVAATHGPRIVLARLDVGGACAAVWPYLETRKGPLRIIGSPLPGWSTPYLGPLVNDRISPEQAVESFLSDALFRRYAYFACKTVNGERPIDLGSHGFSEVLRLDTYVVDLSLPEHELWSNLKSECRTRIRKAQKLGIEVREEDLSDHSAFVDDFWAMSQDTFAKNNIQPTHTRSMVAELLSRLGPPGMVRVISARLDGERVGAIVLPLDARAIYYWGGASYARFRDLPAHNLLHWEAICLGKRLGLERYDMISTLGGPGRFKKTFGPQTVHMGTHWERSSSRLMAALKQQYQNYLLRRRRVQPTATAGA